VSAPRGHSYLDDFIVRAGRPASKTGRENSCESAGWLARDRCRLRQHLATPSFAILTDPTAEHADAAASLFRIENRLREVVAEALSQVEGTWWPSRFPAALVREADQRRQSEAESPAPISFDLHPLAFLDLGELVDVILEEANWEQVFKVRFGLSRDAFSQAMTAVTAVRNKVAHNRPVGANDLTVLRLAVQRLTLWPG
jgi:Swt1-like HEPN